MTEDSIDDLKAEFQRTQDWERRLLERVCNIAVNESVIPKELTEEELYRRVVNE